MTPPAHAVSSQQEEPADADARSRYLPGPLVCKLMLVTLLAAVLAGLVSVWGAFRASEQEAVRRLVRQQTEEVEVMARLLAGKIEQNQRVLSSVAEGITPALLESPASLQWQLLQSLPGARIFDTLQVARNDAVLSVNLQLGRVEESSNLDPAEREYLLRTMLDGKPLVSDLIGSLAADARFMFTMPLLGADGGVMGALAGVQHLEPQGLLPHWRTLPVRDDSQLVVFTREGVILSHPRLERVLGRVQDEPGLGEVYARWRAYKQPIIGAGATAVLSGHIVSTAGMPLPQWMVARVSDSQALLAPLEGAQRRAWWSAAAGVALICLAALLGMGWVARPLAQLRARAYRMVLGRLRDLNDPWPTSAGEVDGLVEACTHMQRQRAQQQDELAMVAGHLQSILEHAPWGMVITRGDMLEVVGQKAGRMLGYPCAELVGQSVRLVHASECDLADAAQRVRDEFAAHGSFDGELRFRRKDGSTIWMHVLGRKTPQRASLSGWVWVLEDITADRAVRQLQGWRQSHDPLTQLMNRSAFCDRLRELVLECGARPEAVLAAQSVHQEGAKERLVVVLFIDLDHFTVVNDVAGHDAGDDVLRHVARIIEAQVRQVGWVARLGGDEFAVALPGCSQEHGVGIAEDIRATLTRWEPVYRGRSFPVTASIGMVTMDEAPVDAVDVMQLLRSADMACYEAKHLGRDQVFVRGIEH